MTRDRWNALTNGDTLHDGSVWYKVEIPNRPVKPGGAKEIILLREGVGVACHTRNYGGYHVIDERVEAV